MLICYPRYSVVMVPTRSATVGVLVRSDIGQTPEGSDLFQDRRTAFTALPWFAPKGFRSSQGRPDDIVRGLSARAVAPRCKLYHSFRSEKNRSGRAGIAAAEPIGSSKINVRDKRFPCFATATACFLALLPTKSAGGKSVRLATGRTTELIRRSHNANLGVRSKWDFGPTWLQQASSRGEVPRSAPSLALDHGLRTPHETSLATI
jgi:hypothetical protein